MKKIVFGIIFIFAVLNLIIAETTIAIKVNTVNINGILVPKVDEEIYTSCIATSIEYSKNKKQCIIILQFKDDIQKNAFLNKFKNYTVINDVNNFTEKNDFSNNLSCIVETFTNTAMAKAKAKELGFPVKEAQ